RAADSLRSATAGTAVPRWPRPRKDADAVDAAYRALGPRRLDPDRLPRSSLADRANSDAVSASVPPMVAAAKWPKTFPPLSAEQERIRDDFVHAWHEELPKKYGIVERFNHGYVVDHAPRSFARTLEIGAGIGEHLDYERLTPEQLASYVALELRPQMAEQIANRHPAVKTAVGDCQKRLD